MNHLKLRWPTRYVTARASTTKECQWQRERSATTVNGSAGTSAHAHICFAVKANLWVIFRDERQDFRDEGKNKYERISPNRYVKLPRNNLDAFRSSTLTVKSTSIVYCMMYSTQIYCTSCSNVKKNGKRNMKKVTVRFFLVGGGQKKKTILIFRSGKMFIFLIGILICFFTKCFW